MTDPAVLTEVHRTVHEHEVFLSFVNDCEAEAFQDWLNSKGYEAFSKWYGKNQKDYQ